MKIALFTGGALLATSLCLSAYTQVGDDLKAAGQNTTDAAKTGAQKTGHAVKKGTKKSTSATKKGVHKAANKVSDKTQDTSTTH